MKLRDLSHDQWAAALAAARALREANPNDADDRAHFQAQRDRLIATLPDGADHRDLISEAVHWYALNDFALAFAGVSDRLEPVR